jgi:hypothetical protein
MDTHGAGELNERYADAGVMPGLMRKSSHVGMTGLFGSA